VQYDDFIELCPYIQYPNAITSHFGYLEQPNRWDYYGQRIVPSFAKIKPNVFCLSYGIKEIYQKVIQIPQHKLFVTPNGVNINEFYYTDKPSHGDRSIYLAKIDYRKRQHLFQSISSLWFAGNIADPNFRNDVNYLGEWSKKNLYENLTNYGNLVLLSDGEAHPLVCMEAFAAGLGVVISQWAAANLDISKEFITVIPEEKINDIKYVEKRMIDNRNYSTTHRQEIREYAKQFDWVSVIEKTYVPTIERIIS
jgi:glycosyltransferase involved in cell wall biosynthesis